MGLFAGIDVAKDTLAVALSSGQEWSCANRGGVNERPAFHSVHKAPDTITEPATNSQTLSNRVVDVAPENEEGLASPKKTKCSPTCV
jgi:hypothetical protein